jgi:hypothetical protein
VASGPAPGGAAGIRSSGSSRPRMGSSLLLSPLLNGKRGAYNGSNVHHGGENSNVKGKIPIPSAPNVEVVCDTFLGSTTRVACRGSLIGWNKALNAQAR